MARSIGGSLAESLDLIGFGINLRWFPIRPLPAAAHRKLPDAAMLITFWGVRGSIPTPGETTWRYGGNTPCISVEWDDRVLIIDAGTGVRPLGARLAGTDSEIYVLLTHLHDDHLQGFPFFAPLYQPGRQVHLLDYEYGGTYWSLLEELDGVHFPLRPEELPGCPMRVEGDVLGFLAERGIPVERLAVNHPGGAYGYRLTRDGRTVVVIPDNELRGPRWGPASLEQIVEFCRGADLLVHDAQYQTTDMPEKWGWGHSTVRDACELAITAKVGHLVLFHHDPGHSDETLDEIQEHARSVLDEHGIDCTSAYEGLSL